MRIKRTFNILLLSLTLIFSFIPNESPASVTGKCSNCHTMHRYQNGRQIAPKQFSEVEIPLNTDPNRIDKIKSLTTNDCIGCHSDTGKSLIKYIDGQKVPVVFNMDEPDNSTKGLAAGNFYWMIDPNASEEVRHNRGHNVLGISRHDRNIFGGSISSGDHAPGDKRTCDYSCHSSLAIDPFVEPFDFGNGDLDDPKEKIRPRNGCEGCHVYVSHHKANDESYRFLRNGHNRNIVVKGYEDPNWELEPTAYYHNEYKGFPGGYNPPYSQQKLGYTGNNSISSFCGGCHFNFLRSSSDEGESSPWHRHPNNYAIPDSGEYADYNPDHILPSGTRQYSPLAPVARPSVFTSPSNSVTLGDNGDMVMCLSCHRAHASPYPDMLRWDPDDVLSGSPGSEGCFICHTKKSVTP